MKLTDRTQRTGLAVFGDAGVIPALKTPFSPDGTINFEILKALPAIFLKYFIDTFVFAGSMGSWHQLSIEDRIKGARMLSETSNVIVGTGALCLADALRIIEGTVEFASGYMIIPDLWISDPEAQYQYFAAQLEAANGKPCMIYNNEAAYGFVTNGALFKRLHAEYPNLVATKAFESNNKVTIADREISGIEGCGIIAGVDPGLQHALLTTRAVATVSGVVVAYPDQVRTAWDLGVAARDHHDQTARALFIELTNRMDAIAAYDVTQKLAGYYGYLAMKRGFKGFEHHFPQHHRLTDSEMSDADFQDRNFMAWWEQWEKGKRHVMQCRNTCLAS